MRARLAWALSGAVVVLLGQLHAQEPANTVISDIRQESADDSTRLVVVSNGPLPYTSYAVDPLTLIVDLPDVDVSKVPAQIKVGTPEVESLRVTSMARGEGRSLARLEVRLARRVPVNVYAKDKMLNLVFERSADTRAASAAPASSDPAAAPATAAPLSEAKPVEQGGDALATNGELTIVPGPRNKASRILGVTHEGSGGQFAIVVKANGRLSYNDFFQGNPDRLVIDFKDVDLVTGAKKNVVDIKSDAVHRVRMNPRFSEQPKVARVVLDLSRRMPYRVVDTPDGLKVLFGEGGETPSPAPLAALRADAEPMPAMASASPMDDPLASPARLDSPVMLPVPVAGPDPQTATGETFQPRTVGPGEKKYTGEPITLDFKDGDLQDVFRLFADISGLNVVVNPGVSGKVTLKLNEVPWDQALDLILKTNGLGYTLEDNVIRIARLTDLQREENDRAKLEHEKRLAGDLVTFSKTLSYAKASVLAPTVTKVALSERGVITLDERTNTMIITDLPSFLEKAKDLIMDLDRPTPQVEIEARIVVTTRNFTRDMGIQWGFMNQMTA